MIYLVVDKHPSTPHSQKFHLMPHQAQHKQEQDNMVQLTDSAKDYLKSVTPEGEYVTLGVKGGGCSGLQYVWGLSNDTHTKDIKWSDPIDEILLLDPLAEMYILGSVVDYVVELGGSFLSVKNPTSSSSCGCGESFGI